MGAVGLPTIITADGRRRGSGSGGKIMGVGGGLFTKMTGLCKDERKRLTSKDFLRDLSMSIFRWYHNDLNPRVQDSFLTHVVPGEDNDVGISSDLFRWRRASSRSSSEELVVWDDGQSVRAHFFRIRCAVGANQN